MEQQTRGLLPSILEDLNSKMVFLSGPRQVGKTTLARQLFKKMPGIYLNWDNDQERKQIRRAEWPAEKSLVVLDELHKYSRWKRFIKGEYDVHGKHTHFLVTGSARLDVYSKGGDSLQGRYHNFRLHPFSMAELRKVFSLSVPGNAFVLRKNADASICSRLLKFGGFPEPYLSGSEKTLRRWRKERLSRVVREDVRDVSNVYDISLISRLMEMLPGRAGSLLSLNSLREDLEVSHKSCSNWLTILESLYYCYRLQPYHTKAIRGLKKETKLYLWDWSEIENPDSRFENLVASHLLKLCHALEDCEGYDVKLWYLRSKEKQEVDFLVTHKGTPWFAVETKISPERKSNLRYFMERLKIPIGYYVSMEERTPYTKDGIIHVSASVFLDSLGV